MIIHLCPDGKRTELSSVDKPCPNCGEYHPWSDYSIFDDDYENDENDEEENRLRKGKRKIKLQ